MIMKMKTVNKPWGSYTSLYQNELCNIKTIEILPGCQPSYQFHHKRAEHWIILSGTAEVTINDIVNIKNTGEYIFVPTGSKHRIKNTADKEILIFVEIQTGSYFGEDDIVRIQDDYGRKS